MRNSDGGINHRKIVPCQEALAELASEAGRISNADGWQFVSWQADVRVDPSKLRFGLRQLISDTELHLSDCGYAVISFTDLANLCGPNIEAAAITLFLTALGEPIRVFDQLPFHWRQIDADLTRPPNRSRGIGLQPLHHDFVNAEYPPDFVCLYSLRPDPLGAGASLVSDLKWIASELPTDILNQLCLPIYADGVVQNLLNVGRDVNPFPVYSPSAAFQFRYTSNLLENTASESARAALQKLAPAIEERAVKHRLLAGELLIIEQRRAVHGREPLGDGQELLAPSERRLVLH